MISLNPFFYGNPVASTLFVNRKAETLTLFSRIHNREPSAIVGDLHIGKTSLLKNLMATETRRYWLGDVSSQFSFLYLDCQELAGNFCSADFWCKVIVPIQEGDYGEPLDQLATQVAENKYPLFLLEKLFRRFGETNRCLVVLLDEFDALFTDANLGKAEILIALRALTTRTDGFEFVTASQLAVSEMNRIARQIIPTGSPLLNTVIEVPLKAFSKEDALEIIRLALQRTNGMVQFSTEDNNFILSLAGTHPFLVQIAGASLFDAITENLNDDEKYNRATRLFSDRALAHIDEFWRGIKPSEQRILLSLALKDYHNHTQRRPYDFAQLGKPEQYSLELRHLQDLGFAQPVNGLDKIGHHKEDWRITCGGIVLWLIDHVIFSTEDSQYFVKWLSDKEFQGLLTREQTNKLKEIASAIPKGATSIAADFIREIMMK